LLENFMLCNAACNTIDLTKNEWMV